MGRSGRPAFVLAVVSIVAVAAFGPGARSGGAGEATGADGGDPAAFCARWEEARSALLGEASASLDRGEDAGRIADEQLAVLDAAEPLVPDAIEAEWDTAAGFRRAVTDVLFAVNFHEGLVRPVHLEAAFDDAGVSDQEDVAEIEAAAVEAVEAIDAWTVTGCGDFCGRWPEVARAIEIRDYELDPEGWIEAERADAELLARIRPLVPVEVGDAWDEAVAWRALKAEATAAVPDRPVMWPEEIEQLAGVQYEDYVDALDQRLAPVLEWVEANCESVGTGVGAPGTLSVEHEITADLVGRDVLGLVVPPGTAVTGLTSTEQVLGGECRGVGGTEAGGALMMREFSARTRLCEFTDEPAVLDPGSYDVVVLAAPGLGHEGGDLTGYLPAPESCVRFPVVVDGDMTVQAPPLEPCDLAPIAGDAADAAGRQPASVDPGTPGGGRLTVVFEDALSPLENPEFPEDGGRAAAVVLPAGTTLDQVGRGDVWPAGTVCLELVTPENLASFEGPDLPPGVEGPFPLPVTAFPPTGSPACWAPWELGDDLVVGAGLDPVVLAPGRYDVHLEAYLPGQPGNRPLCTRVEVVVDGDTSVEPPPPTEWESCP